MNAPLSIKASKLQEMAIQYADQVTADLGVLNKQYPRAEMDPKEEQAFLSKYGHTYFVDLESVRFALASTFCQYMASRFVILPED
jgi:hypothetical protein